MPEESSNGRSFFRTPAKLTVHYGPDTSQARRIMAMDAEIWETQTELESAARQVVEDGTVSDSLKPLLNVILWMDFKIDLILHHLRTNEMMSHFPHVETTTDISGSGFGLRPGSGLKPGTRIVLTMNLPDAPSRPLFAVGEVVRCDNVEVGEHAAAVQFLDISEADRERLIRFTFRQQRRELARRAGETKD